VLVATREALVDTALAGIDEGGHEGLVLWAGRELNGVTVYTTAIIPTTQHSHQSVHVSREEVGAAGRAARLHRLGIIAQVHSHPGPDGRHSDGDDTLILMPFAGMLSIVAPHYGRNLREITDCAVHQFQDGQWVWCEPASVARHINLAPVSVDLR
jgi:proteasome lid subunit RPN8/RPN11